LSGLSGALIGLALIAAYCRLLHRFAPISIPLFICVKAVIAHRRLRAMRNTLPAFPNPAQ
jgi:hypothetical protein